MSNARIAAVRGMNDLLPVDAQLWETFESRVVAMVKSYGYQQIRTPIIEHTSLFKRGIGEVTDIVETEMYSFVDRLNGEELTLRPENTAAVVRAVIEHNLLYDGPKRLWYMGPMFRHERPQRGRYRQFHQVGVEAMGYAGPDVDAEQILMLRRLWQTLGIGPVRLEINCLGQAEERAAHRADLIAHFERHADSLDADAKRRLHSNPLRILDSKNPAMAPVVTSAPQILDYLSPESRRHFDGLRDLLDAAALAYTVNPRLVRGLDYYNLTVFEWISDRLGAQGTICGGGRYDPLIEHIGGKPAPATGFAMGIERVVELMREANVVQPSALCDAYVVHQGGATLAKAMQVAESLRDAGLDVLLHAGESSMKSQMKRADASGAEFAVIVGESEVAADSVAIKALRAPNANGNFVQQRTLPISELPHALVAAMSGSAQAQH